MCAVLHRLLKWISALGTRCNPTADDSFANLYFSSRNPWLAPLSSEGKSVDGGKLPVTDPSVCVVQTFAPLVHGMYVHILCQALITQ